MRIKTILTMRFLYKTCLMTLLFCMSVTLTYADNEATKLITSEADVKVTGTIKDVDGEGLPGVTIVQKGTTNGTVSDIDGNYAVFVPSDAELVFTSIGYVSVTLKVGGRSVIDVVMAPDVQTLSEIVVVGFGEQKKSSVVGSIVQTTGKDLVQSGTVPTVSEALRGLLPGVTAVQQAGIPGASQAEILIRGQSSWNNNSPLTLVDGIERDFNSIDINEIQSISVLKDASAVAVYGVRGANGVILVTTKRGRQGDVEVNFSANYGIKSPIINTNYHAEYAKTLEHYNIALRNDGNYSALLSQREIDLWRNPERDPNLYSYTDWVQELLGTGRSQRYNVNISGGNEKVRYFTSLGYNFDGDLFQIEKQPEYDPRTFEKRYNFRTNVDVSLTKSTEISINLSGDITNWNGNPVTAAAGGNGIGNANTNSDDFNLQFVRLFEVPQIGSPFEFAPGQLGRDPSSSINTNFKAQFEREGQRMRRSNRLYSDFILKQDLGGLIEGLSAMGKLSYNSFATYNQRIDKTPLYFFAEEDGQGGSDIVQFGSGEDVSGPALLRDETFGKFDRNLYYELSASYNKKISKHELSGLFLFNRREFVESQNRTVKVPSLRESWVGRATYNYDGRYLFEVNGSYTGVNKFARGKRFGFFPSVAIGWVITQESFMKNSEAWLDLFKIRYSYGQAGDDQGSPPFIFLPRLEPNNNDNFKSFYGNDKQTNGSQIIEQRPPTVGATWETSTKQNLGIELGFLKRRLTSTIDFFSERRTDIFMTRRAISVFFGSGVPEADIGETKSHGVDIELGWQDDISDKLSYWVKGNISLTENRVVFRDDAGATPDYQKLAGKPIGSPIGNIVNGFLNSWDDVYNSTESSYRKELIPGDFQYGDYNADGIISNADRVPILFPGSAQNSAAWSFGANYGNLSVSVRFNAVFKLAKTLSSEYLWESDVATPLGFGLKNNEQQDFWTPENLGAQHPSLHTIDGHNNQSNTTHSIRRSDFVKLQSAEISYALPMEGVSFIENFQVYVNGNNLYTWSKLPDSFDPEARQLTVFPTSRIFSLGCRVRF